MAREIKNMVGALGIELRDELTGKVPLGSYKKRNRCIGGPNDVSLLCGWPAIWVVGVRLWFVVLDLFCKKVIKR